MAIGRWLDQVAVIEGAQRILARQGQVLAPMVARQVAGREVAVWVPAVVQQEQQVAVRQQ